MFIVCVIGIQLRIMFLQCILGYILCCTRQQFSVSVLFLEPKVLSNFQESFILNDLEYIFTNRRLTWEEAEIDCSFFDSGSLAIIDNLDKAHFLALALGEIELVLEDFWIGASVDSCLEVCSGNKSSNDTLDIFCKNNTCFKWTTGDYVDVKFMLPRFREEKVAERKCLSFARNDHRLPSFVDLYCKLKRPYLCQRRKYWKQRNQFLLQLISARHTIEQQFISLNSHNTINNKH